MAGSRGFGPPWEFPRLTACSIVTKDEVRESNSHYAQGGIAGVLDPEDRFDNHIADTIAAGKGLCDLEVVEMVVREAPTRIAELIAWGTSFDEDNGHVALGREGGHSHARIVHALGDETGREIMRAIIQKTRSRPNIRIWQNSFTIDLLTHEGRCRGASGLGSSPRFRVGLGPVGRPGDRRSRAALSRNHKSLHRHRLTVTPWRFARAPSSGTWSSCSSIPRSCTWPDRRTIS